MRIAALALAVFAISAAAFAQGAPEPRTDVAELRKVALADPAIKTALDDRTRTLESRLRDERRMVELILRAGEARPGQRVLDVASGGGYLALLFAAMVGDKGHVDIHNTPGWIAQFPSMEPERQQAVITQANIGWVTQAWNELDAAPGTYDLIVLGQVYHDIVLEGGDFNAINQRFFAMLKPGGRIVIEDHDADERMYLGQQADLHRISHGDVTGHFLRAGFEAVETVLIDSRFDDRRMNVFWPNVRGRTDRFIAVFRKPA